MALEAQNNPFTSILMVGAADPEALAGDADPSAGSYRLVMGTDDKLYILDETGNATEVGGAAGAVATDAIWDAAGDLAVGSGANTAARLAIGNAGAHLSRINGAVAWDANTSFPTMATGDRFWRSDLGMEFYYDGTNKLCTCFPHQSQLLKRDATATSAGDLSTAITASGDAGRSVAPSIGGGSDIWLVDCKMGFFVSGGTALGASHKWVGTLIAIGSAGTSLGTVATINIDSGSSDVFRALTATAAVLQPSGTLWYQLSMTKTGTPGSLQTTAAFTYRIVAT